MYEKCLGFQASWMCARQKIFWVTTSILTMVYVKNHIDTLISDALGAPMTLLSLPDPVDQTKYSYDQLTYN